MAEQKPPKRVLEWSLDLDTGSKFILQVPVPLYLEDAEDIKAILLLAIKQIDRQVKMSHDSKVPHGKEMQPGIPSQLGPGDTTPGS